MSVLAGFAPDKGDRTAIALGATLARSAGTALHVVSVVPAGWPTPVARDSDRDFVGWSRERGRAAVAEAQHALAELCPDLVADASAVEGRSIPTALAEQAASLDAAMVVVGSGSGGRWGHITVNSTADRLLHSSEVPVAIAPRGYRPAAGSTVPRVTYAFRDDPASHAALARTAELCRSLGTPLRVVTFGVRGRTMYPVEVTGAEDMVLEQFVAQTTAAQEAAVTDLRAGGVAVDGAVAVGRDWSEALDDLPWDPDEVLVLGSSATGPVARVFLGSTATRIIRLSPVPVVVVP